MKEKLIRPSEAALLLGISADEVLTLENVRVKRTRGGHRRVVEEDVLALVASRDKQNDARLDQLAGYLHNLRASWGKDFLRLNLGVAVNIHVLPFESLTPELQASYRKKAQDLMEFMGFS